MSLQPLSFAQSQHYNVYKTLHWVLARTINFAESSLWVKETFDDLIRKNLKTNER